MAHTKTSGSGAAPSSLRNWITADQYLRDRQSFFPNRHSLDWFIRRNRRDLVEGAAVGIIAGRLRINPERFDEIAARIGQRVALERLREEA
jgi:hypothetical protein